MYFSLNFLKQIIEINLSPQELAEKFTAAGLEVEKIKKSGQDWIFEAEVTTNRYDWLSVIGVAQEAAAVTGKKLKIKYPRLRKTPKLKKPDVTVESEKDCLCYLARQISSVKPGPSPAWLKNLITNSGLTSVSNIVDVTNYAMLKWGNPLHAFDFDKIEGNVCVRRARPGEIFLGIDQKRRELNKENLVIADDKKVIALAGVMGAKNTEVTPQTKNIFLEAAVFSPVTVRRSRRQAGLDTESSYRFERRVPLLWLEYASQEAVDLILKLGGGDFSGYFKAGGRKKEKPKSLTVDLNQMQNYLGIECRVSRAKKILESLNFEVERKSGSKIKIKPASSRFDIQSQVDVYEEFARVYGYNKIKPKIPFLKRTIKKNTALAAREQFWKFKNKLRDFFSLAGFREIVTYSLENREELSWFVWENGFLGLENPLRSQEGTLRPTLLLGMAKGLRYNLNRGQSGLKFFEIADIYKKKKDLVSEESILSLGLSGPPGKFFLLKGAVLDFLKFLNIEKVEFQKTKEKGFINSLKIFASGEPVGFLGKLDQETQEKLGLKEKMFAAEINLEKLYHRQKNKKLAPFSCFPFVCRDISLAKKEVIEFEEIRQIVENESRYLSGFKMIDTYQGKNLPQGYFAFTLRLFYQSQEKTLSSDEVDGCHNRIRKKLNAREGVILR